MRKFLYLLLLFSFLIIFIRVVYINFKFRDNKVFRNIPDRGNIVDVNGNLLVYSQKKYNAYINKKNIPDKIKTAIITNIVTNFLRDISQPYQERNLTENQNEIENEVPRVTTNIFTNEVTLTESMQQISDIVRQTNFLKYFEDPSKNTFLLGEYLSQQQKDQLVSLKEPFLLIEKTYQRKYFLNDLLSHSLGFTGRENKGLNGLEYYYEYFLSFKEDVLIEKNIYLNVDLDIQYKVQQLLKKNIQEKNAESGVVIVQDIESKKIVAIANSPSFDLTQFKKNKNIFNNQAVSMNISPGSIFKIFFLAYLLEKKKIDFNQQFYCNQDYYISKKEKPIKCSAAHGYLQVDEILKYSCNSAMIEICKKLTKKEMYQFLTKIKIGEKTGIDLPYEGNGILPHYKKWKLRTKSLIPIGYGLTVTPIQMLNSFTTFIGNGYWQKPKIAHKLETHYKITDKKEIKNLKNQFREKIISASNVNLIRQWLLKSVEKGSTGYLASRKLPVNVMGKTSTAQIIEDGSFSTKKYNSGFAGSFPYQNPKYSLLVLIKNPKPNHSGGKVAAPLFNKIVRFILNNKKLVKKTNQIYTDNQAIFLRKKENAQRSGYFPNLVGLSYRDALIVLKSFEENMKNNGVSFSYQIRNERQRKRTVIGQSPSHRQKISFNKKNRLLIFFD